MAVRESYGWLWPTKSVGQSERAGKRAGWLAGWPASGRAQMSEGRPKRRGKSREDKLRAQVQTIILIIVSSLGTRARLVWAPARCPLAPFASPVSSESRDHFTLKTGRWLTRQPLRLTPAEPAPRSHLPAISPLQWQTAPAAWLDWVSPRSPFR